MCWKDEARLTGLALLARNVNVTGVVPVVVVDDGSVTDGLSMLCDTLVRR
jgi:hypothetical protein